RIHWFKRQREWPDMCCPRPLNIYRYDKIGSPYELGLPLIQRLGKPYVTPFAYAGCFYYGELPDAFGQPFGNSSLIVVHHFGELIVVQPASNEGMTSGHDDYRVEIDGFQTGSKQ